MRVSAMLWNRCFKFSFWDSLEFSSVKGGTCTNNEYKSGLFSETRSEL